MADHKYSLVTNADDLDHPHCRILYDHWATLKDGAKAPAFLDVLDVPEILPFASIASASEDGRNWTISYFGGALAKFHDRDLTGETVNIDSPFSADPVAVAIMAWDNFTPCRLHSTEMVNIKGETKIVEMLTVPLSRDGRNVSEVIQAFGIKE